MRFLYYHKIKLFLSFGVEAKTDFNPLIIFLIPRSFFLCPRESECLFVDQPKKCLDPDFFHFSELSIISSVSKRSDLCLFIKTHRFSVKHTMYLHKVMILKTITLPIQNFHIKLFSSKGFFQSPLGFSQFSNAKILRKYVSPPTLFCKQNY